MEATKSQILKKIGVLIDFMDRDAHEEGNAINYYRIISELIKRTNTTENLSVLEQEIDSRIMGDYIPF